MERSVEGDFHNASDSKSSRSEPRRSGLSINLNLPLPVIVNERDCQNFSIRQYVAEMRKRNMKICSSFGSSSNLSEQLPSLDVSEHKRWCCANYTHKIGDDENAGDEISNAFVNTGSTNFVSKDGDRVDEASNIDTDVMLSKKCSNREIETNDPVDAPMNKGIKISQKKRKVFQKNDCGFEMDDLGGNSAKRSKAFNQRQNIVRNSVENIDTNSCPRDNGYDREQCCQLSGIEGVKIKRTSKRDSEVSRKKHKQHDQVMSGCSLHIPFKGKNSDFDTNRSDANILIQASHASPSIGKVECHLRNANRSLHTKKDSDLRKMLEDTHDSSHMYGVQDKNLQRDNLSKREDVQKSIGMGMMTSQTERELYFKEKLIQTLKNFKNDQKKYVENDTVQTSYIPHCPSTILKGNKSCDFLKANGIESSHFFKKGVLIPIKKQPIMFQSDQSSRNEFINLNRTIDLNHRQEFCISSNLLQQNKKIVEVAHPVNSINITKIQNPSYDTTPQRNQQPVKYMERGPSTYVPSIDNMEMFRNRHEKSNLLIQNGILPQVKEQSIKLSNSKHISSVSTGWRLQNIKISNPVRLSIAQNTTFQPYNLQNHENHKCGQVFPGSLQKGQTISDLKSVNSIRGEGMRNKGVYNGFVLPHHQLKECYDVYMGDFTEVQNSRQHISYLQGQGVSLRSQEKEKKAHAPEQFDGRKLQLSASSIHTISDSGSKVDLVQNDNIFKRLDVVGCSTPGTVLPVSSIPEKDPPCLFNQNPIDIMDVDDERYFRTAEDQRIRDNSLLRKKYIADIKLDERQRQTRKERPWRMPVVGLKN